MNCDDTRRLLEADLDGELDLVRHLELNEHLRLCADCARWAEAASARRTALRATLPRFTAPAVLADRVRTAIRTEAAPAAPTGEGTTRRTGVLLPFWSIASLAASIVVAVFVGYGWGTQHAGRETLMRDLVADHVRSLQVNHLTDVASTDQHTVKPWFAGKLDFSPPVVDLAGAGYPLIGGRLETIDGHTAAALVFHRRQHAINVFIWPHAAAPLSERQTDRDGFHVVTWTERDLSYAAVSEIPSSELESFVTEYRRATQ